MTSATPSATPIPVREEDLAAVEFGPDGLVPVVVQDEGSGKVLMLGWMDAEALRRTLSSGRMWYWSRHRQEYWRKGDTSGDRQWVRSAFYDCDGDALLFVVDQEGRGACHTGTFSCFERGFGADRKDSKDDGDDRDDGDEGPRPEGASRRGPC